MARVLVLGGTSSIARALERELASEGIELTLAGRDLAELDRIAADLRIRYDVPADTLAFHAQDTAHHRETLEAFLDKHGDELSGAYWCIGTLATSPEDDHGGDEIQRVLAVNLAAAVSSLSLLATTLEGRGEGFLCAVSSVAGDRGRSSNHLYGASKAGLDAYLEGLRQRLASDGVQVTTVKPGFVDTKMTHGREDMFLVASPERVARAMIRAVDRGRSVVYVPWYWRPVGAALRTLPTPVFERLEL